MAAKCFIDEPFFAPACSLCLKLNFISLSFVFFDFLFFALFLLLMEIILKPLDVALISLLV